VLDASDQPVASVWEAGPISPGRTYWRQATAHIPLTQSGSYFLILKANSRDYELNESDHSNNTLAVPVTFNIQSPDLVPILVQPPNLVTGPPNPILTLVWGITNQGAGAAGGSGYLPDYWYDEVYFLSNSVFNPERDQRLLVQQASIRPLQ